MTPPSSDSRRAGTRLGPYEILARIGTGGMGEVFRARDSRLNRDVAIKVLPEEFATDRNRLKRFEQEARAVSTLSHPNIVTVFEIGESEAGSYIAMELVEGQTLRQLLRPGGIPVRKILDVGVQIADGLARAHEAGIVHRDLKPDNVMVTPDGLVKVLDFGLAKLTRSPLERGAGPDEGTLPLPTQPGVLIGTVRYMSPEQAGGHVADYRADQFAFGAVLYEMATGNPAFQGNTTVDTLAAILHDEPPPLTGAGPKLPPPLRWVIERCLAKDPKDRYAATRDLAQDFNLLRQHMSEASWSGIALAPRPSLRRWRSAALVAAAAAAALTAGLFLGRSTARPQAPRFQQVTFRNAGIDTAAFTSDGQSVVYAAQWEGRRPEIFETRLDHPNTRPVGLPPAEVLSVSRTGEMAILLLMPHGTTLRTPHDDLTARDPRLEFGMLARVPISGGTPRELLDEVLGASWAPNGNDLAVVHFVDGRNRLEYPIGTALYVDTTWLNRPRISPDGNRVAFVDVSSTLLVVDRQRRIQKIAPSLKVGEAAWSPSTGEIWYTAGQTGTTELRSADLTGHDRFVTSLAGDFTLFDISAAGRVLLGRVVETAEIFGSFPGESRERNLSNFDRSMLSDLSRSGDTILLSEAGRSGGGLYLRRTDGSPAKKLADSGDGILSPDGKYVLTTQDDGLSLLPTGAGPSVPIAVPGLDCCGNSGFFPDGRRIYFVASEPNHNQRVWIQDLDRGERRAVTPEGTRRPFISGDGRYLCARDAAGSWNVYPTGEGEAGKVAGLEPGEEPFQWTADGKGLYVRGADRLAPGESVVMARVFLVDPWSGRRELFKQIPPVSPTTGGGISTIRFSADGKICAYTHHRYSTELFLAEGLK